MEIVVYKGFTAMSRGVEVRPGVRERVMTSGFGLSEMETGNLSGYFCALRPTGESPTERIDY